VSDPFLLSLVMLCRGGWEVVQLAVHQILDLIILVRVQASQPNRYRNKSNKA